MIFSNTISCPSTSVSVPLSPRAPWVPRLPLVRSNYMADLFSQSSTLLRHVEHELNSLHVYFPDFLLCKEYNMYRVFLC